jgi:hypothetical protein
MEQLCDGCLIFYDSARHAINQKTCGKNSFIPKTKWNVRLCKESKSSLNKVTMFAFYGTILLVGMRARDTMSDANAREISMQFLVLATPICLNSQNFGSKRFLNTTLKLIKNLFYIGLVFQQVNPSELTIII